MALDGYYSMDYFPFPPPITIPAASIAPSTHPEFPYYSAEEDQQLLLHLNGFLSDFDLIPPPNHFLPDSNFTPNFYPDLYTNYDHNPQDNYLLDYDYRNSFYELEPPPKRQKRFHPPLNYYPCSEGEGSNYFRKDKESGPRTAGGTPQSIAARDRRKKISDKTMQLAKLVPGASNGKMNTAEMFENAIKYVKFMQSQLSLLQLLRGDRDQDQEEVFKEQSLQIVGSSAVQEKLYMKDKCLVPVEMLEQLANDGDLKSQGSISMDLKQLMQSLSDHNC